MRGKVVSSSKLAESVDTNPVVIRRLIKDLKAHGIVKSLSGSQGGFAMAKSAKKITLWDVYFATREDEFFKQPKVNPECVVSSNLKVLIHDIFGEAEESMRKPLQSKSIAQLDARLDDILGDSADQAIREGQ